MKVQFQRYNNIDSIPDNEIQQCKKGKWSDWKRTFIVKSESGASVIVLNFFQRIARSIQAIFQVNYFKSVLGEKKVTVISPNKLEAEKQKERLPNTIHETAQETLLKKEKETNVEIPSNHSLEEPQEFIEPVKPKIPEKTVVKKPKTPPQNKVHKMDDRDLNRILNRGLTYKTTIDPKTFDELIPKFKEYVSNKEIQQNVHGNKSNEYILIDFKSFGNGLDDLTIKLFIRYLTLTGEIFGFSIPRNASAILVELKDPGVRKRDTNGNNTTIFRKEDLLALDELMKKHEFPPISDYATAQHANIQKIYDLIESEFSNRILNKTEIGISTNIKYSSLRDDGLKALDDLVKKGIISSWNYISRGDTIGIKLAPEDTMPGVEEYVFKAWRDRDFIEKEAAFKAANTIHLRDKNGIESRLSRPEHIEDLNKLVEELNKRTAPGIFEWKGKSYSDVVVQALKDLGYIHGFKKTGLMGNSFEVYVTKEDEKS